MNSRGVVKLAANEEREGRELLLVKIVVSWEEMRGIARAEAVGDLGERVADFQKSTLYLCVVYGRKGVEDSFNFPDAVLNDVTCEGDVADRSAEQHKAVFGGPWHTALEGVVDSRGAAPNQRFQRV